MQRFRWIAVLAICIVSRCQPSCQALIAQSSTGSVCPRPEVGSVVGEPVDLHSENGILEAELTVHNVAAANGATFYCYTDAAGSESPNLRVHPGDLVILHLKNALTDLKHESVQQ